ncbi:AroM family protein [Litchfieldia alkalitelluris]|uniref:AroM family protein n=1 Tax=Litchfieldia alkalitelluris TaxID=304268 RepID=UPI000997CAD7|nr:AroM family protein [Litchfieldia alkalitelluris]
MSKKKIGLITIGQSPRVDLTPEMEPLIGEGNIFVELGALDDLTSEEIEKVAPFEGDVTYVSRLRSGAYAKMSKQKILPLLQEKVLLLENEVSSNILVCTGSFPNIKHNKPLLFPDKILNAVVDSVLEKNGVLGVMVPLMEQKESLVKKWGDRPLVVQSANPYQKDDDFVTPARKLKELGATVIVLDCMGYTEEHKRKVKEHSNLPVILSRSIVARVAAELA